MDREFRKPSSPFPAKRPTNNGAANNSPLPAPKPSKSKGIFRNKKLLITVAAIMLLIGIIGGLTYAYIDTKNEVKRLSNPEEIAKEESKDLVATVGKLTELPQEEPTVATVSDKSKLEGQEFFKNAQNGDKVMIFTQAKKAVLYRPSTGKIIEIAPINLGDDASAGTQPSQ